MRASRLFLGAFVFASGLGILPGARSTGLPAPPTGPGANLRTFTGTGIVEAVKPAEQIVVIRHEAISNYMAAMTMPFHVKSPEALAGLQRGDAISFQLHVTGTESWVDHLVKTGAVTLPPPATPAIGPATPPASSLLDYPFTNELGRPVSFNDFRGQALAVTFFYTRCPLPDYCPRLSKNFQETELKLEAMTNAPANWHLLSVSFDPTFDTPAMLKAYGDSYHYDPKHWSFLTGPAEKIGELARGAGVSYEPDGGAIAHNFRTLVIDARGRLQMVFPTSGDLSDQIVAELIKAAAVTNQTAAQHQGP